MKEDKDDIFMLTPVIFNNSKLKEEMSGAYTITIPLKEMKKFETEEELYNFLFYHYNELYFMQDAEVSSIRYEFFFKKLAEEKMKET